MDYLKNAKTQTIEGVQLHFIRCDSEGNEFSAEELAQMSFTNAVIERVVRETAGRIGGERSPDGGFFEGFVSG